MNKKDLSDIRKEFKLNSYMLKIKEVYSVYLKKDNGKVLTKEKINFKVADSEVKGLYLNNFKKVLTGSLDSKIFELNFKNKNTLENLEKMDTPINTQQFLYDVLNSKKDMTEFIDSFIDKLSSNFTYDSDVVINFVQAEYYKSDKKNKEDDEAEEYIQAVDFILCSINKVVTPKKTLKFDHTNKQFKPNSVLDFTINLSSPLDGFMFPSFCSDYVNSNKLIYYSSKSSQINSSFIEKVLECTVKCSAMEEKGTFNIIIGSTLGKVTPDTMQNIYESIYKRFDDVDEEDYENLTLDMKDISEVLKENGLENSKAVEAAFEELCGGDYAFKVKNILPDFQKKSIKLENDSISISVSPNKLNSLKQIKNNEGKKCILIELSDDVMINGLKLQTQEK